MRQNMQNGTISEIYTDDKNHLRTLTIFLSQLKPFIQKRQTYKTAFAELFSKAYNKRKISI